MKQQNWRLFLIWYLFYMIFAVMLFVLKVDLWFGFKLNLSNDVKQKGLAVKENYLLLKIKENLDPQTIPSQKTRKAGKKEHSLSKNIGKNQLNWRKVFVLAFIIFHNAYKHLFKHLFIEIIYLYIFKFYNSIYKYSFFPWKKKKK